MCKGFAHLLKSNIKDQVKLNAARSPIVGGNFLSELSLAVSDVVLVASRNVVLKVELGYELSSSGSDLIETSTLTILNEAIRIFPI